MNGDGVENLFNHVHEIWINPELERRVKKGLISSDFKLYAAQILSFTDGRENEIRFNDEVKAELIAIASKTLNPNEKFILEDGISEIKNIKLIQEDDPNAGHLTILNFKGNWVISFDFRYNKKMAKDRIEAAQQFYESAILNHKNNLHRPMSENLFASAELLVTAQLLLHADSKYTKQQHHTATINRYIAATDLGNFKIQYKEALLELKALRNSARYLQKPFILNQEEFEKYLKIVQEMIEFTKSLVK